MQYPQDLLKLIAHLKKLPGVGKKTAERFAFHLLEWKQGDLGEFATALGTLKERIHSCDECGCLMDGSDCFFCNRAKLDTELLCVIASPKDAYAIEETGTFRGVYHVLGTLLSPLDGKMEDQIDLSRLHHRIEKLGTKEVIIALDSTLEGDATALFIKREFHDRGISVSRLALGLPLGSSLDFVDEGTLSQAISGRQNM